LGYLRIFEAKKNLAITSTFQLVSDAILAAIATLDIGIFTKK